MNRRDFLRYSASTAITAAAASTVATTAWGAPPVHEFGGRILVLIELAGGNDGLNTVIPYADPAYAAARPALAIARDQVLPLDERLGLHAALEPLMASWRAKDLALVLGVGYPRPDRSHFRSIDIWNTASDSDRVLTRGWAAGAFDEAGVARNLAADALIVGGDSGPFHGGDITAIHLGDPARFVARAGRIEGARMAAAPSALDHILRTRANIVTAAVEISNRLDAAPDLAVDFPATGPFGFFGRDLEVAAQIIAAEVPVAAIKLTLGSFDTHAGQPAAHRNLLARLGSALAAFRQAMIETGHWHKVLVMTYAEFGRRVAQNASGGTDHGTAAPHFVLGGRVRGGLYGAQPSLTDLDTGDLKYTVDFRRLFATATETWWGLPPTRQTFGDHRPLTDLLA